MTLETSPADAAPTRRSRRRPVAPVADEGHEVSAHRVDAAPLEAVEVTSLAESAVVAGVTAAIAQVVAEAPLTRAELRRRRAADAAARDEVAPLAPVPAVVSSAAEPLPAAVSSTAEPVPGPAAEPLPASADEQLAGTAFSALGAADACLAEDFDFSAQLFAFTAETPVQVAAAALADDATSATAMADVAPRRRRINGRAALKRMAGVSFSLGVMATVGLLAVGTTTPASIAAAVTDTSADIAVVVPKSTNTIETDEIQAYVAASDLTAGTLDRTETYDIASMADIAADSGVTHFAGTWVNDPAADIQWPFPVGVPVSAAYGSASYLAQFSSPHHGVDLAPGAGADVHVIADGTVRLATEGGGDYGVNVIVDHVIDGQLVSTRYAHMQYGSLQVSVGDTVSVGDVLGKVGSTGKATGPHLHFEVLVNGGVRVDPYTWMQQHTTS